MGDFAVIRPRDDAAAQQAADWCDQLVSDFLAAGHAVSADVDDTSPADTANIISALGSSATLVCYFGHGDDDSWLTGGTATIDASNVGAGAGKAVVSVACRTGRNLGPDAITAGVTSWLGFTIKVPVFAIALYKNVDPIGEAIVGGLSGLGTGGTMGQARAAIEANCDQLAADFDSGPLATHPVSQIGYYAALSLRDHVVLHGSSGFAPL